MFIFIVCLLSKTWKMIPSPDPADPPGSGPRTAARHLPNTPGVRMTWVENKLPQTKYMSQYIHFSNTYFLQNRTHYLDPGLRLRYISHNVKHFPRDCCHLREFVKLPSSWPWRVGRGPPTSGSWLHFAGDPRMPGRPPETAGWIPNRAFIRVFTATNARTSLRCNVFCWLFHTPLI